MVCVVQLEHIWQVSVVRSPKRVWLVPGLFLYVLWCHLRIHGVLLIVSLAQK